MTGCTAQRHGNYAAYRRGCRCPNAREDDRLYSKRRREGRHQPRRISRIGAARRLQALAALGWRWTDLAGPLGVGTRQAVQNLATRERGDAITTATAEKVDLLYQQLAGTRGPSDTTRSRALAKGWAPPQAWDDDNIDDPDARPDFGGVDHGVDDVLVEFVMRGLRPFRDLNQAERVALWQAWTRHCRALGERPRVNAFAHRFRINHSRASRLRAAYETAPPTDLALAA